MQMRRGKELTLEQHFPISALNEKRYLESKIVDRLDISQKGDNYALVRKRETIQFHTRRCSAQPWTTTAAENMHNYSSKDIQRSYYTRYHTAT